MKIIKDNCYFKISEPTVVTIGKFDGRHKGHQLLLDAMKKIKEKTGYRIAVFSFDVAPVMMMSTSEYSKVITTKEERRENLEQHGVDYLIEYPFTKETARMDPVEFVETILMKQMNGKAIVVGTDCGFGYKRAGNVSLLESLKIKYQYELVIIEKQKDDDREISSTYIREEIAKGNMEKVAALLGYPYSFHGTVVYGNQIGGPTLGFPTANIIPEPQKQLPPFGVYVSKSIIGEKVFHSVSNIGKKPTVESENNIGIETHILGLDENLYGKEIEVQLLSYIRPEKKFDSLESLKKQIASDTKTARDYKISL